MSPATPTTSERLIEQLFRREAGALVSSLTRVFGVANLDLAEDVVQDALLRALRSWPFRGFPDDPGAWLLRVAKNRAVDALRRESRLAAHRRDVLAWSERGEDADRELERDELEDESLRLMFVTCHPVLSRPARVALTLKVVAGFSVAEIARAFLDPPATVAQRLVRAKRRLRDAGLTLARPTPEEIQDRLDSVLEVLYLVFNEGYTAHAGEALVRRDLVDEARRLAGMLGEHAWTRRPETHALLALFCFQSSRLSARTDDGGQLILLAQQDRSLWDRQLIARGFRHLALAGCGDRLSVYHAEAGIASLHAAAPSFDETEWTDVLALYDALVRMTSSPVVRLNRVVAVMMVQGVGPALDALDLLTDEPRLAHYHLLPATRGEVLARAGRCQEAARCFAEALARPCTEPERAFLRRRRAAVATGS